MGHGTRHSGSPQPASSSPIPFQLLGILGVPHGSGLNKAFHGVKSLVLQTDPGFLLVLSLSNFVNSSNSTSIDWE